MARWFVAGDPDFAPAPLPAARDGAAYVMHEGALWVLGGWNAGYAAETDTAYRYDIHANAWSIEAPVGFAFEAYSRGVADGELLYFATPDGEVHSYHTGTSATGSIGASGVSGYHDLARIGRFLYIGLASPTPRRYDLDGASWSNAPGVSPYAESVDYAAVIEYGGWIVVLGGNGTGRLASAWLYDPSAGAWWALPDLPVPLQWHDALVYRDQLHVLSGEDITGANLATFVLGRDHLAWSTPYDPSPLARAGAAVALVFNQLIVAGGYDYGDEDAATASAMLGGGLSAIDATGSVDFAFNTDDAWLTVTADIDGGPGVVAIVYASAVIGRIWTAELTVYGDILASTSVHGPVIEYGELGEVDDE
jgi:hypothetical protein